MHIHASLRFPRRLVDRRLLLSLSLAGFFVVHSTHAASFDCSKATTAIEHAICDNETLSQLDSTLNEKYQTAMANLSDEGASELRKNQRSWLKERDACNADAACLENLFNQRKSSLQATTQQAETQLDAIIASIPADPANAAYQLKQYRGPLASAWLVYLNRFEPTSGVTAEEAKQRHQVAVTALNKQNDFAASLLKDIENDPKTSKNVAVLTFLRMTIEQGRYDEVPPRPDVHCFVFSRQGDAAYRAFGALWGSSRDSQAPICPPQGNLFELPAWKQLNKILDPVMSAAYPNSGTIRYASYADWAILRLRATLSPTDFLKPIEGQSQESPEKRISEWDDKSWPKVQREQLLIAIDPASKATMEWLQTERKFTASDASKASTAIVNAWLNEQLDYLSENLSTGDQ
ncbi:uncharacterized protein DUF1311 [Buttiauxella sp. JUb87]|uniref:lysozyme inhibitor LprI family protein n=1 Tax=Buttiauxella sp. JUb87 TaxID=2485129 RepID=UPI0010E34111|nr:lysozyme inhibitor LprI family protein [Buttiauxella sp. JUb87]TDN51712.1 uncharacterized protein DUF1311 [Buttiauxella sp. JUb87]